MYTVIAKKNMSKKLVDKNELIEFDGFLMASKNKTFKIGDTEVREIKVINKKLANPLAAKKVFKQYDKLIVLLTELMVDDDDSGDSLREALNQIEKFRLQIKNRYREYLEQKELLKMSKQLKLLQQEASKRLLEMNEFVNYREENHIRR